MKMFHWNQMESLRNYANGDLIVMAPTPEDARTVARFLVKDFIRKHRSWWFVEGSTVYPEDQEDYNKWMATFEADILKDPDERIAVFLTGSE